jgi:hypothetical protein
MDPPRCHYHSPLSRDGRGLVAFDTKVLSFHPRGTSKVWRLALIGAGQTQRQNRSSYGSDIIDTPPMGPVIKGALLQASFGGCRDGNAPGPEGPDWRRAAQSQGLARQRAPESRLSGVSRRFPRFARWGRRSPGPDVPARSRNRLGAHEQRSHPRCKLLRLAWMIRRGIEQALIEGSISLPAVGTQNCRPGAVSPVAVARATGVDWVKCSGGGRQ